MEFVSPIKPGRLVASLILFGCFLVGIRETRSPIALAARGGDPWPFWVILPSTAAASARDEPAPELFLGIYLTGVPAVELVSSGPPPRGGLDEAWERLAPILPEPLRRWPPDVLLKASPGADNADPSPVACADWLEKRGRGFRLLKELFRDVRERDWERLRLDWELSRVPRKNVASAFRPPARIAEKFYADTVSPSFWTPAAGAPLLAEVLNASNAPGLAARVTKVLRLKGIDVVNLGNASSAAPRTIIYDRDGRIGNARKAQEALEDHDSRVVTQLWERPWLDISLVLK
jgi:hypothetical protein